MAAATLLIYGWHRKGATGTQRGRRMLHLETNCRSEEPTQPKSPAGEMQSDQLSSSYAFSGLAGSCSCACAEKRRRTGACTHTAAQPILDVRNTNTKTQLLSRIFAAGDVCFTVGEKYTSKHSWTVNRTTSYTGTRSDAGTNKMHWWAACFDIPVPEKLHADCLIIRIVAGVLVDPCYQRSEHL